MKRYVRSAYFDIPVVNSKYTVYEIDSDGSPLYFMREFDDEEMAYQWARDHSLDWAIYHNGKVIWSSIDGYQW